MLIQNVGMGIFIYIILFIRIKMIIGYLLI